LIVKVRYLENAVAPCQDVEERKIGKGENCYDSSTKSTRTVNY